MNTRTAGPPHSPFTRHSVLSIAIIGAGRLGTALTAALHGADLTVLGPYRRGELIDAPAGAAVILAVPEREISALAASMPPGTLVGHCSASLPLEALAPTIMTQAAKPMAAAKRCRCQMPSMSGTQTAPTVPARMECRNGPWARSRPLRTVGVSLTPPSNWPNRFRPTACS